MTPELLQEYFTTCEETKKSLPDGPWMHEEHRLEFKRNGLDCLISRNPEMFNWCGYVAVPKGHPLFGKDYNEIYDYEKEQGIDISVHGGLTYSNQCNYVICHVTDRPEDEAWWFGFDCAHGYDLIPGMLKFRLDHKDNALFANFRLLEKETYKDVDYVVEEVIRLADQLSKIA